MKTIEQLLRENKELRHQLNEAEETLHAIREGQVDAIVVDGEEGTQVFSLSGAETVYRLAVETMAEAALNVTPDGRILFCNARFAEFVATPLEHLPGCNLADFVAPDDRDKFHTLLKKCAQQPVRQHIVLRGADDKRTPVHLTGRALHQAEGMSLCLVASNLTELESSVRQIDMLREHQLEMEEVQAKLRAAHDRTAAILESMSDCFVTFDREWRYTYINAAAAQAFRMTSQQMLGKTLWELWPAAEGLPLGENFRRSMQENVFIQFEQFYPEPLNRWFECRCSPTPEGLATFFSDITERKQAEEALRQSEERMRSLADNISAVLMRFDRGFRAVYLNDRSDKYNAVRAADIIGKSNREIGMPEHLCDLWENAMAKVFETGEPRDVEFDFETPGGNRTFFLRFTPEYGADGKVEYVLGVSTDITGRKKVEEALRAARHQAETEKRHLEAVLQSLPVGVIITDTQGGVLLTNGMDEQIWGTRPSTRGVDDYRQYKAWWAATGEPVKPEEWASAQAVQKGQSVIGQVLEIQRFDGTHGFVHNSAVPIHDADGRIIGSAVAVQDITEQKQAEQALRASEEKYRNLFENMAEEVHFWKLERDEAGEIKTWRLVDANPPTLKSWGYKNVEEIRGKTTDEVFGPGATAHYMPVVRKIMTENMPHSYEDYFENLDKYFRFTSVPFGEYFITTGADITLIKKAEEALRESEARYRSLFNNMVEGFALYEIITDDNGSPCDYRFLDINPAFEQLTGLRRDALVGKRVLEVLPGTEPHWIATYGQVALTSQPAHFENYAAELDRWYEVIAYRTAPRQFAVIFSDISDRKRAQEELEALVQDRTFDLKKAHAVVSAERQRFKDVLDQLPAYLVLLTPDYHVPFANRFFEERFGVSNGRRCYEYLFNRTEPCDICDTYKTLKNNAPVRWEWIGPDGRNYDIYDFPFTDMDGSPLIMEVGLDVTEQKLAEAALRQASAYNRSLIEASLDPLVTIGPDGRITDVNAATEAATGCTRNELIGADFSDYFTEPEQARASYEQVFREGSAHDYALELRHRGGRVMPVLYNASLYRDAAGEVIGVFAAARDITSQKQAEEEIRRYTEELMRSNDELQHFAYVASHDLQEPLRAISSFSQLLAQRYQNKLDADADDFINFIVDGAKRMQTLINDLLTYSRVGTRGQPFAPVEGEAVLRAALANLAVAIDESAALVTHDPLPTLVGDRTQLVLLFQNLISNAIKFCPPEKPPCIHISAVRQEGTWQVSLADNGIGIEPQYFERVFVIFQRLHERDKYPGTGIGLAICKKIIERHGGRIWVESSGDSGSTFHFTLPERKREA